jgi:hypothetical protein
VLLTDAQYQKLAGVGRARSQLERDRERVAWDERILRSACARAVAHGIPLRRVARVAQVSHETVRSWVAQATLEG